MVQVLLVSRSSEGKVVKVGVIGRTLGTDVATGCRTGLAALTASAVAAGVGAATLIATGARGPTEGALVVARTSLEVHDRVGCDLQGGPGLAVTALEGAGLEATLHEDLVALAQGLGHPLGAVTPDADAEPVGLLDPLARLLVLRALVDRHVELGHRAVARRVAH